MCVYVYICKNVMCVCVYVCMCAPRELSPKSKEREKEWIKKSNSIVRRPEINRDKNSRQARRFGSNKTPM